MKNLTEFLSVCNSKTIPESEMYNFIREYTNDFDIKSLEYLRGDLNKFTDNIKFTLINETTYEYGSVEQQDRPTTVVRYLKTNKIDPDMWTPRQKVNFVLNDIENKKLNYYSDESIFRNEIEQYLKFTDMIERECKDRLQPESKGTAPPPAPPKKHNLPTINTDKYNSGKIYETYNNVVFKCSKDCFNALLVDGFEHKDKIEFILKGRKSTKTGKETLQYAQLRKFIETITGNKELTKDAYYKAIFGLKIKTSSYETATTLSNTFKDLKLNRLKK